MFDMKHLIVVLLVVLLVFGAKKLRTIGSDLGAPVRGFKQSVNEGEADAAAKQIPPQRSDAEFTDGPARATARQGEPRRRRPAALAISTAPPAPAMFEGRFPELLIIFVVALV